MEHQLTAQKRLEIGKGPSRRLRVKHKLPAVLYGLDKQSIPLVICPKETSKILRSPLKRNTLINLHIEGDNNNRHVMIKERQIHPTKRDLTHVDFIEVNLDKKVLVSVPVLLTGRSEAMIQGGKLDHVLQKMRIHCLPHKVPEAINVDVTNLSFGSTHTSNITLPEGASLAEKPNVVVLTIKKPRGAKEEEAKQASPAQAKPAAQAPKAPSKK